MLTYAKLALAVYNVLKWVVTRLERHRWIGEGKAQMAREQLENMFSEVLKARDAESAVSDDFDSVQNDPNNRDRDTNGS